MRQAFEWLYQELDSGRTRRSAILRARKVPRLQHSVKAGFQYFDQLVRFDRDQCPPSHALLGLDEVGRGPLAGPLVAACVRLPYPVPPLLPFLRDSKKLAPTEREFLAIRIRSVALAVGIGVVEPWEFGAELNLHYLTFLAMQRALDQVSPLSGLKLLVDGKFPLPSWNDCQTPVIKGDDKSLSIAAASVVAKVHRDCLMRQLDQLYPQYGFAQHVGYGTDRHREALLCHGPCPAHRANFVSELLNPKVSPG